MAGLRVAEAGARQVGFEDGRRGVSRSVGHRPGVQHQGSAATRKSRAVAAPRSARFPREQLSVQVESLRVFEKYGCGQECQIHRSKIGIVLFGQLHASVLASPAGPKMIRFPPSPEDQLVVRATKSAHLLRLTRYPQPYPRFQQNRRRFTCGFVFTRFGMVGGKRLNVVDGPVSWRALLPYAQKCRHGGGRCLRGGWGWGGGYVLAPRQLPGALGPGRRQFA